MQEFLYNVSKIVLSVWQVVVVVVMEEKVANTTTTKTGPASRRKSFNKSFVNRRQQQKLGVFQYFILRFPRLEVLPYMSKVKKGSGR